MSAFLPLPRATGPDGAPRVVGVELEFGGLAVEAVARTVAAEAGGTATADDLDVWSVTDSPLGTFKAEIDTALKRDGGEIEKLGREMILPVVPVELVCPPVPVADLPRIDAIARALADAGAAGTAAGALLAFGIHLNVSVAEDGPAYLQDVTTAFALLEDWIRHDAELDLSRRALPFVDPYPRGFVDALVARPDAARFAALYLAHNPTRNRALDLTPVLAEHDPQAVARALGPDNSVSARPAFHYRLPDCRLDEPGWSLAEPWGRWVLVERMAGDTALLDRLCRDWTAHRDSWTTLRMDWRRRVDDALREAGLLDGIAS